MMKRVLLGALLVGLIAVLVIGAINRTRAWDKQAVGSAGQGERGDEVPAVESIEGALATEQQGSSSGDGTRDSQQNSNKPDSGTGTAQAAIHDWLELHGQVESVDEVALIVAILEGENEILDCRAWEFAQEQGFLAQVGDQVLLRGFFQEGDFKVGQVDNLTNGQSVILRNSDGMPLWTGTGKGVD